MGGGGGGVKNGGKLSSVKSWTTKNCLSTTSLTYSSLYFAICPKIPSATNKVQCTRNLRGKALVACQISASSCHVAKFPPAELANIILYKFCLRKSKALHSDYPFKDEAQTALFKDPVRTAL